MKREIKGICGLFIIIVSFSVLIYAQTELTGEISGVVMDEMGDILPGVTITLTGPKLFQKSISKISNEKGIFRFLNLNPGNYELTLSLQGFNTLKITDVAVRVGKSTPIRATMTIVKIKEEVEVVAETPLIETKTTQISTSFTSTMIDEIPTGRNLLDLMDAVPGINDKGAYGSGGYQDTGAYDVVYTQGSPTSTYLFNSVDVSDLLVGTTWVNPAYETIEEIQVVGIGASAEHGDFTGASFNVITKSGGNNYNGGLSTYYTNSSFYGDNSGGIENFKPGDVQYSTDTIAYLGGPLIKEKLFFFLAGGYTGKKTKGYFDYKYGTLKQPHFYIKLDWLVDKNNSFTFLINHDPLDHLNLGQKAGSGPEISYDRLFRSTTLYGSWLLTLSDKTIFELKYAGFRGRDERTPQSLGVLTVNDWTQNRTYGSSSYISEQPRSRNQYNVALTHYIDEFLGASHEFKFGLAYEQHSGEYNYQYTGPNGSLVNIYPSVGTYGRVIASVGVIRNHIMGLEGFSGYAQNNIKIGNKIALNLGLRFDIPKMTTEDKSGNLGKYSLEKFTNIAPRIGFSYDFSGKARDVLHVHYGRYFQKMVATSFWSSLPGSSDASYYSIYLSEPFVYSEQNAQQLFALATQPENLLWTRRAADLWDSEASSSPYTDVFNIGFEKMLGKDFVFSIEYIHKRDRNFIQQNTRTQHSYEEVEWTDPWLGNTITLWRQTDNLPEEYYIDNSSFAKRNHNFLIFTLKKREVGRWSIMASFTYQKSEGNLQ